VLRARSAVRRGRIRNRTPLQAERVEIGVDIHDRGRRAGVRYGGVGGRPRERHGFREMPQIGEAVLGPDLPVRGDGGLDAKAGGPADPRVVPAAGPEGGVHDRAGADLVVCGRRRIAERAVHRPKRNAAGAVEQNRGRDEAAEPQARGSVPILPNQPGEKLGAVGAGRVAGRASIVCRVRHHGCGRRGFRLLGREVAFDADNDPSVLIVVTEEAAAGEARLVPAQPERRLRIARGR
jgi:hypothetical protein